MLSGEEKRELLTAAGSPKLREDIRKISGNRINPFILNGEINMDLLLEFLTQYNAFIGHKPRKFRKIIEREMKI
jgi:hypothetical protein